MHSYAFRGKGAWYPPENATPSNCPAANSGVLELSSEVPFVSVLPMVLSGYWKRLVENFRNQIISAISQNIKTFPPTFFCILKEPLLVKKQTIPQTKALILSFLQLESLRTWHYQEGTTLSCTKTKSIFCWIFWVFDFLLSMRSLGHHF